MFFDAHDLDQLEEFLQSIKHQLYEIGEFDKYSKWEQILGEMEEIHY